MGGWRLNPGGGVSPSAEIRWDYPLNISKWMGVCSRGSASGRGGCILVLLRSTMQLCCMSAACSIM